MNPNLGFRAALEQAMAQVEDLYQVPIEVVVVGDQPVGEYNAPLLQAAREAAANASRHSGAPRVDVFAEVGRTEIEVFVRDTGSGFEPDEVDADPRRHPRVNRGPHAKAQWGSHRDEQHRRGNRGRTPAAPSAD